MERTPRPPVPRSGATTGRLSLRLHSQDFLPSEQGRHPSFESLVLARLRCDSARAAAISARAAEGLKSADLLPANTDLLFSASAADIQVPVVSGVGQGSGEYFSRVGVGRPARQLYMVLDTGSDVTWLQCQPCADCYTQSDPVYDPSLPTSYAHVGCDSPRCHDLDAAACHNAVRDFATETLTTLPRSPTSPSGAATTTWASSSARPVSSPSAGGRSPSRPRSPPPPSPTASSTATPSPPPPSTSELTPPTASPPPRSSLVTTPLKQRFCSVLYGLFQFKMRGLHQRTQPCIPSVYLYNL
ncbi:hypothetical protein ACQ4PT_013167 [Festuca glaucescens]